MEKCAYCGDPIGESPIMVGDEVFCSEDCLDEFESEPEDDYDDRYYEGDESAYDY